MGEIDNIDYNGKIDAVEPSERTRQDKTGINFPLKV